MKQHTEIQTMTKFIEGLNEAMREDFKERLQDSILKFIEEYKSELPGKIVRVSSLVDAQLNKIMEQPYRYELSIAVISKDDILRELK